LSIRQNIKRNSLSFGDRSWFLKISHR